MKKKNHSLVVVILSMLFSLLIFSCEDSVNNSDEKNATLPDPVDPGPSGSPGPSATKVLFIGNSLTYSHNQPTMFYNLANEAGKEIYVDQATIPDVQLGDHLNSDFTKGKINAHKWDVVILQGAVLGIAFPEYHLNIMQPIKVMKDIIHTNHSDTQIFYFLLWSMKNGVQWNHENYTYEAFQKLLCDGTVEVAEKTNVMVAPVGWAWYHVIHEKPEIELYAQDGTHPSRLGSYLGACVYFVSIFQESVEGNSYIAQIEQDTATYLQEIATSTVMDSLDYWNIPPDTTSNY